jgi:eukaryotic-like serine/threonine-protein kinase
VPADGGIRFGQYVLLRRIARGGMAEVFLAHQRGLEGFDRRVAVKRILPHLADAPDFVRMFLGEAKLAAQLSHPNIVHIYDFGKVEHDYFLAMEYVEGIHAGQVFKHGERSPRMSPTLVARIGADAAAALHYAHELMGANGKPLGLVHRDVSPANIMVSYDGIVKLCDFGIAKAMAASEQLTNPGQVKGKYAYMSPEQTIAAPLDGRSDVFSLAIVLWELLAGKNIVPRGDAVEAMRMIRDGRLPPIDQAAPHVPAPLAKAIAWALETKRERRATAADLHQALEAFIKASPELATPMQLAQWVRARFPRDLSGQHPALTPVPERLGTSAAPGTNLVAPGTVAGTGTHLATITPPADLIAASVLAEPDETAETIAVIGGDTVDERPSGRARSATTDELANRPTTARGVPRDLATRATTPRPLALSDSVIRAAEEPTRIAPDPGLFSPQDSGVTILPAPGGPPPLATSTEHRLPSVFEHPGTRQIPPLVTEPVRHQRRRVWLPIAVLGGLMVVSFLIALAARSGPTAEEPDAGVALPIAVETDAVVAVADAAVADIDIDVDIDIDAAVEARPETSYLVINTIPPGATVKVGDQTRVSPTQFAIEPGTYEVLAELDGYKPERRKVTLEVREHRTYDIALTRRATGERPPPQQVGTLSVRTNPYSNVFLGLRKLGQSPFEITLPAGKYTLQFKNPAYPTATRTIRITPGKVTKVVFDLKK